MVVHMDAVALFLSSLKKLSKNVPQVKPLYKQTRNIVIVQIVPLPFVYFCEGLVY